jgi:hypothetical protein
MLAEIAQTSWDPETSTLTMAGTGKDNHGFDACFLVEDAFSDLDLDKS